MASRLNSGLLLGIALVPYGFALLQGGETKAPEADFEKDAMAVFRAYCLTCHSGGAPTAGLDLSTPEGIRKGGTSGPLFVPGKPDASLLIHRVKGTHGLAQMPKGFAPLDADKIEGLRRWISAGGSTKPSGKSHWAYRAPTVPALPSVRNPKWVRNPIDRFVLVRLEKEGLAPSPEASRETQLRRVSLDLTGLPPTVAEIDRFLNDRQPNSYERAVDRLLASPAYGERQARLWLDLARYADTNGYEADRPRTAYKYRDWVIAAFNRNMPYDEFSIEQLAGDLLPGATLDQRIATGFHRNSMWNEEGGVDANESMFETIVDRVGTTSTVWMGSTMACARCHDHKFDPFTQNDFYRMYAYFANNRYEPRGDFNVGQRKYYEPLVQVPTPAQEKARRALGDQVAALRSLSRTKPVDAAEWRTVLAGAGWMKPDSQSLSIRTGTPFKQEEDGSFLPQGKPADQDTYTIKFRLPNGRWTGLRLEALPDATMPLKGPGRSDSGNFVLSSIVVLEKGKKLAWKGEASFIQQGYNLAGLQDENPDTGWALYQAQGTASSLVMELDAPFSGGDLEVVLDMASKTWPNHLVGRFRLSATQTKDPRRFATSGVVDAAVAATEPSKEQLDAIRAHGEKFDPVRQRLADAQMRLNRLNAEIPTAMILSEKFAKGPLKANLYRRGEFLNKGPEVEAGTPGFLPPKAKSLPDNRLGLAKWLFSKSHPLTARVQANRMWALYFGRGLVETEEDFGTQGAPPSHPELLDWLACELRDNGWDLKRLHRMIVTSATYRQSSRSTRTLEAKDPQNILLARGPRFRMEAEMIRDTALRASGLLSEKVGGPSVMPYQPEGVWDNPFGGEVWRAATTEDRYRRGLYVYWRRTAPYPSFLAMDATSRETCTVRRIRTNTPLQALALMNDRAYLEAAVALAEQALGVAGDAARIELAFRSCTGRKPDPAESKRLAQLVQGLRTKYRKAPSEAKKLIDSYQPPSDKKEAKASPSEVAAWTMVCNVLLNLDETVTKN